MRTQASLTKEQSAPADKVLFAVDLDHTLVTAPETRIQEEMLATIEEKEMLAAIENGEVPVWTERLTKIMGLTKFIIEVTVEGWPLPYKMTHILHPGAKEFIQLLFSRPNSRVCFYSAGSSERNTQLVDKIMLHVFGREQYELLKPRIYILSKEDLVHINNFPEDHPLFKQLGRKDLSLFFCDRRFKENKATFQNTILIDDRAHNVIPSQAYNFMRVSSLLIEHIISALNDPENINQALALHFSHLIHAAGLLTTILNDTTLTTQLFNLQFLDFKVDENLVVQYDPKPSPFFLYSRGLAALRKFNPSLKYYHEELLERHAALAEKPMLSTSMVARSLVITPPPAKPEAPKLPLQFPVVKRTDTPVVSDLYRALDDQPDSDEEASLSSPQQPNIFLNHVLR